MAHIKKEFLEMAKGRSKELYRKLLVLSKFAVLGVMTPAEFDIVCAFLKDIGAKFGTNDKFIIWLEILPKSTQNLFTKYKDK